LEARLSGSSSPKVMTRAAALWTRLLAQIAYRDVMQPYPEAFVADVEPADPFDADMSRKLSEERLRLIAEHRPTGDLSFDGELRIINADAIAALIPTLPPMASNLVLQFRMESDAET